MENEKNPEEIQEEVIPAEAASAAEETPADAVQETSAESADAVQETAAEENTEQDAAEEKSEDAPRTAAEEAPGAAAKKLTPGKLALMIGAGVLVVALIVALIAGGMSKQEAPVQTTEPAATTEPVPTIPADGNPDDETCKGTYTVSDEEAKAAADTVVAVIGQQELTNAQLQTFYWMQVQNFLTSEYGSYMQYYGMLDYTQPLDMQVCAMAQTGTWQQFFLKEALNTWQNYCALSTEAQKAGLEIAEQDQAFLDNMEQEMELNAQMYGLEDVDALLAANIGPGASLEDFRYFQETLVRGNVYYDQEYAKLTPTQEELETYFAEHEAELAENGITREGTLVDVRHVLLIPDGGTTDESGNVTYSDAEWDACRNEAENLLNSWTMGEATEESFAAMAMAYSEDPGSQANGGLYQGVYVGQMVPEFNDWCFDAKREPGHSGLVKTSYGYHLMYFVGSMPIWQNYATQAVLSEKTAAMMEDLVKEYPMEVTYGDIVLGYVNLAG